MTKKNKTSDTMSPAIPFVPPSLDVLAAVEKLIEDGHYAILQYEQLGDEAPLRHWFLQAPEPWRAALCPSYEAEVARRRAAEPQRFGYIADDPDLFRLRGAMVGHNWRLFVSIETVRQVIAWLQQVLNGCLPDCCIEPKNAKAA